MIQFMNKQNKILVIKKLSQNLNGEHQMMEVFQNKIGVNTHVSLKKVTLHFGRNMKKNSGKIIMRE